MFIQILPLRPMHPTAQFIMRRDFLVFIKISLRLRVHDKVICESKRITSRGQIASSDSGLSGRLTPISLH